MNQARKKGSSTWILSDPKFLAWSHGTGSLLCTGIIGSGKTVLAANVVEGLKRSETSNASFSLAYFFCRPEEVSSLQAREIFGSFARQFFEVLPNEAFEELDSNSQDLTFNVEQLVSFMLNRLPPRKYILLLDGVDACVSQEFHIILESLEKMIFRYDTFPHSEAHNFRLFWTGRSDLSSKIHWWPKPNYHVHITHSNNGAVISQYIETALEDALVDGRLTIGDPTIILEIKAALELGAQDM